MLPAPDPSGSEIPDCHTGSGNPRFALGARKARGVRHSFAFTARRCSSRDCELHEEPCAELTAHTVGSSFPFGFAPPVRSRDRLHTTANRSRLLQGALCRGGLPDPHPAGSALLCSFPPNFAIGQQLGRAVAGPCLGGNAADSFGRLGSSYVDAFVLGAFGAGGVGSTFLVELGGSDHRVMSWLHSPFEVRLSAGVATAGNTSMEILRSVFFWEQYWVAPLDGSASMSLGSSRRGQLIQDRPIGRSHDSL